MAGWRAAVMKYCPRKAVYFPKYVCINNPRLAAGYWCMELFIVVAAVVVFFVNKRYFIHKPVFGEVSVASWKLERPKSLLDASIAADLAKPFCTQPDLYTYESGRVPYTNISCVRLCDQSLAGEACIFPQETAILRDQTVFIPTFFTDIQDSGNRHRSYFVPGVEDALVAFTHRFSAIQPRSAFFGNPPPLIGGSDKENVLTVILNNNGEIVRFAQPGEVVSLTARELLAIARLDEYRNTVSKLDLDNQYVRVNEGIIADRQFGREMGPSLRLSGVKFTIELKYANHGQCVVAPSSPVYIPWDGKLCCVSIKASRTWTSMERNALLSVNGDMHTRLYHGMHVYFSVGGSFMYFDFGATFDGLTTVLIWLQIPLFIIYWFITTFLGNLSTIYNRVIHESFAVDRSSMGLAARLVVHSSAWSDLRDTDHGLSKQKMLDRFRLILKNRKDLDDSETMKFVDFIYKAMVKEEDEGSAAAVQLQPFVSACTENETLSFESLVQVFDMDRPMGFLEKRFNDDAITIIRERQQYSTDITECDDDSDGDLEAPADPVLHHSLLQRLERRCQEQKAVLRKLQFRVAQSESRFKEPTVELEDGSKFHGKLIDGVRHGHGVEIWPDGSRYEGQWEVGTLNGIATHTTPTGIRYDGQWLDGKAHGYGVETSEDGAVYKGDFQKGSKTGKGTFTNVDGSSFVGQFQDDMMQGRGRYFFDNKLMYDGQWDQDVMHGQGEYTWPSGEKYNGQYRNGKRDGRGVFTWSDGRRYEGCYQDNERHGEGIFWTKDGVQVSGLWEQGKQHGPGTITLLDGRQKQATWEKGQKVKAGVASEQKGEATGNAKDNAEGKEQHGETDTCHCNADGSNYRGQVQDNMMQGHGRYEWSNKHVYEGQWQKDLMHGQGKYTWISGETYEGQYLKGRKHGHGIFKWPDGRRYDGGYEDNERHGEGVFWTKDGVKMTGTWKAGKQHGTGTITLPDGRQKHATWENGRQVKSSGSAV